MKIQSVAKSWLIFAAAAAVAGPLFGQTGQTGQAAVFFPQPIEVEQRLVQTDLDGRFEGDPVKDTYVGNFLVSERADGSRLVVDLARREMTEIRPQDGSYWTIDFDRFADLRRRFASLAGPRAPVRLEKRKGQAGPGIPAPAAGRPALEVEEVAVPPLLTLRQAAAGEPPAEQRADRPPGVRRFRVALETSAASGEDPAAKPGQWLEIEVDGRWQFSAAATAALARYEADAFAAPEGDGKLPVEKALAAVRARSGLALAWRTTRPLYDGDRLIGSIETEVLQSRLSLDFDQRKLLVPEGLRRRPHPLELVLRQLEQEQRIDDALAGAPAAGSQP